MKNAILPAIIAIASSVTAAGAPPAWLENDSAAAIEARTRADFSLTLKEGSKRVRQLHPGITDADINRFIAKRYLEVCM